MFGLCLGCLAGSSHRFTPREQPQNGLPPAPCGSGNAVQGAGFRSESAAPFHRVRRKAPWSIAWWASWWHLTGSAEPWEITVPGSVAGKNWVVVGPPLWKIWLRQLGWLETQFFFGKIRNGNQTTNQKMFETKKPVIGDYRFIFIKCRWTIIAGISVKTRKARTLRKSKLKLKCGVPTQLYTNEKKSAKSTFQPAIHSFDGKWGRYPYRVSRGCWSSSVCIARCPMGGLTTFDPSKPIVQDANLLLAIFHRGGVWASRNPSFGLHSFLQFMCNCQLYDELY